jgi:DNA ligase (NAD+)
MNLNELITNEAWDNPTKLINLMKEWSNYYYNNGNSPVEDHVYDAARAHLKEIDPNNSFIAEVGSPVPEMDKDGMIKHNIAMGSLDNVNNEEEFRAWWKKNQPGEVVLQYKYDGLSLNLEYENGKLLRGLTRGDGIYGENQTLNISNCYHGEQINNLNEHFNGSIRGEGIVYKEDFNDQNFPGESNPRNSAVGAIRKTNSPRVQWVKLACYDIACAKEFNTEIERLEYMEHLGVPVCFYQKFDNPDDVIDFYNQTEENRNSLPFMIDGLVIKINSIERQKELGSHKGRPKWARAFKFATMKGTSIIRKIDLTVGHTGAIIPTAEYDDMMIDGRCFRHALLDNFDTIEKFNLNIGDEVEIEITGDIIPKIRRVITHNNNDHFLRPIVCPICNAPTEIDGAVTKCTSDFCDAKSLGKIKNWINKTGIKHFGEARQKDCYEAGLITKIADLYIITENDLGNIVGNGNAVHICKQIEMSRELPLDIFMGSLGVKFLGRSNAKKLIKAGINTVHRFLTFDPLVEKGTIDGFGDNLLAIRDGIDRCHDTITSLIEVGVNIIEPHETSTPIMAEDGGKSFCFTGVRLGDLKNDFEAKGWVEKSGVSKNLDYLVAKDPTSTSSKIKKAQSLDVAVISLEEFKEMLNS